MALISHRIPIIPAELYRDMMEVLKWGSALWLPGKAAGDIHIGDVGFVAAGDFQRFFYAPCPEPGVRPDLPSGFHELEFDPDNDIVVEKGFLKAYEVYHTAKLKWRCERIGKTEVEYTFDAAESETCLVIPLEDADRRRLRSERVDDWLQYSLEQYDVWFKTSRVIGLSIRQHRIMLVNSLIVTKKWIHALFLGKGQYKLHVDTARCLEASFECPEDCKVKWDGAPSVSLHLADEMIAKGLLPPRKEMPDQILFVQGFYWRPPSTVMKLLGAPSLRGSELLKEKDRKVPGHKKSASPQGEGANGQEATPGTSQI